MDFIDIANQFYYYVIHYESYYRGNTNGFKQLSLVSSFCAERNSYLRKKSQMDKGKPF